ncbi:hypothetical protein VTK73DRAFT_9642 [Phialemonium thermophilum]|uniref:Uncharacterized protein n=1 Tax=Phialemonium thermophilum TaxID=223376 RepID=A0ABR3W177_9PEZI
MGYGALQLAPPFRRAQDRALLGRNCRSRRQDDHVSPYAALSDSEVVACWKPGPLGDCVRPVPAPVSESRRGSPELARPDAIDRKKDLLCLRDGPDPAALLDRAEMQAARSPPPSSLALAARPGARGAVEARLVRPRRYQGDAARRRDGWRADAGIRGPVWAQHAGGGLPAGSSRGGQDQGRQNSDGNHVTGAARASCRVSLAAQRIERCLARSRRILWRIAAGLSSHFECQQRAQLVYRQMARPARHQIQNVSGP